MQRVRRGHHPWQFLQLGLVFGVVRIRRRAYGSARCFFKQLVGVVVPGFGVVGTARLGTVFRKQMCLRSAAGLRLGSSSVSSLFPRSVSKCTAPSCSCSWLASWLTNVTRLQLCR